MKCKARTIIKVLLATAILCLFTVVGASAEKISGTFNDAKLNADGNGFVPNNEYTYEFDTGSGHLTIDAAKNADGSYANSGDMTLWLEYSSGDSGDTIPKAYVPWYGTDATNAETGKINRNDVKSVTIGSGIHKLGRRLVSRTAITELTVPSTINSTTTEWGVASDCKSLKKVTIGDGACLGDKIFAECTALEDVYLEGAISANSKVRCFYYKDKRNINLHFNPTSAAVESVKKLKENADANGINYVLMPNIPYTEFSGEFKDQAGKIFEYKFEITSFPSDYDFSKMPKINGKLTVNAKDASTSLTNTDGNLVYPWKSGAWADRVSEIEFGGNMTNIGRQICQNMTALKSVTIPSTVTTGLDWGAFLGCSSLESVHAENSNVKSIINRVFGGCGEFGLYLPDNMTSIAELAFSDSGNNPSTPTLHWNPANAKTDKIIFDNINANKWANAKLAADNTFEYDVADTDNAENAIHFKLDVGARTLYITKNSVGNGKMADLKAAGHTSQWGKWVNKVEIGDGVKRIGGNAISALPQLKKVEIGKDVEELGTYAFNGCNNIEEIVFGDKVTNISSNAINGCTALKKVTFSKNLKTVGAGIFRYSASVLDSLKNTEFAPDIEVVGYAETGLAEWAHGVNADYPSKFIKTEKGWNGEAVCLDVKFLNDDGSVKYVLIKDGSTSSIAKEAVTEGYKIVKYGVPTIEIAADGSSANVSFTGSKNKGIAVAAKHNENGMTAVQFGSGTAQNAGYYTINFNDTFKKALGTVSVMLWEGIDTMKPLCASVSR